MSRNVYDPTLRFARMLPRTVVTRRTVPLIRWLDARMRAQAPKGGVVVTADGGVDIRVFRPQTSGGSAPGMLFIHGGGYVIGTAAYGDQQCRTASERYGMVAASVEYRLAPEHPFPAPLEDCYTALRWLAAQPDVDASRIAIVGESAGGGLAAALAQLARDRGEVAPAFQLLSYPMLDDRTDENTSVDHRHLRWWSLRSNRYAWDAYLGRDAGATPPPFAVPARCADLSGLPPAWIGVGSLDLFHDEALAYARRLQDAGVDATLHVVPGAYHGFDTVDIGSPTSLTYREEHLRVLAAALGAGSPTRPDDTCRP